MGIFKAECSECHAEVGLNRFKISDGWLCPDCMKKLKAGFGLGRSLVEIKARAAEHAAKKASDQNAKRCVECQDALGTAETRVGWLCRSCLEKLGFSIWKGPAALREIEEKILAKRAAAASAAAVAQPFPPQEAQPLNALTKLQFRKFVSDQSGMDLQELDGYLAGLPEGERQELISAFQSQSPIVRSETAPSPAPAPPSVAAQPGPVLTQPQCPKCNSFQTTYNKQGFSAGKAIAGVLLAPGGVLWGFHGKNKIVITCLKCGHQWKAG